MVDSASTAHPLRARRPLDDVGRDSGRENGPLQLPRRRGRAAAPTAWIQRFQNGCIVDSTATPRCLVHTYAWTGVARGRPRAAARSATRRPTGRAVARGARIQRVPARRASWRPGATSPAGARAAPDGLDSRSAARAGGRSASPTASTPVAPGGTLPGFERGGIGAAPGRQPGPCVAGAHRLARRPAAPAAATVPDCPRRRATATAPRPAVRGRHDHGAVRRRLTGRAGCGCRRVADGHGCARRAARAAGWRPAGWCPSPAPRRRARTAPAGRRAGRPPRSTRSTGQGQAAEPHEPPGPLRRRRARPR